MAYSNGNSFACGGSRVAGNAHFDGEQVIMEDFIARLFSPIGLGAIL
jgi:hypothetical protein